MTKNFENVVAAQVRNLFDLYINKYRLPQCQPVHLRKMVVNLLRMNYAILAKRDEPLQD